MKPGNRLIRMMRMSDMVPIPSGYNKSWQMRRVSRLATPFSICEKGVFC